MGRSLKKQLIIFALQAAVVIIISAVINGYLINRIRGQQNDIEDKKAIIARLSLQEDKLAELKKEYNDVIGALFIIEDSLPSRLDPRPVKNKVLKLAKESGNEATFVFLQETATPSQYPIIHTVSFALTLKGTLNNFYTFLEALKKFKHFMVIEGIKLTGEPDINTNTTATINAKIYLK